MEWRCEVADRIEIEIAEDGEIIVTTPGISGKNHASADQFLAEMEKLAGGARQTQKKRVGHVHLVEGKKVYHKH